MSLQGNSKMAPCTLVHYLSFDTRVILGYSENKRLNWIMFVWGLNQSKLNILSIARLASVKYETSYTLGGVWLEEY